MGLIEKISRTDTHDSGETVDDDTESSSRKRGVKVLGAVAGMVVGIITLRKLRARRK